MRKLLKSSRTPTLLVMHAYNETNLFAERSFSAYNTREHVKLLGQFMVVLLLKDSAYAVPQ